MNYSESTSATKTNCEPKPPKGLWFDEPRKRWRVRVFWQGAIYHLSYHTNFSDALETLGFVKEHKAKDEYVRKSQKDKNPLERIRHELSATKRLRRNHGENRCEHEEETASATAE